MAAIPSAGKIMIIRHAEKPPGDNHPAGVLPDGKEDPESLTVRGWLRAGALVPFFAPSRGPMQDDALETPLTIIASWKSKSKGSQRPLQTVTPLAEELKLAPQQPLTYPENEVPTADEVALGASGPVLICWQHEDISTIATTVAGLSELPVNPVPPSPWPPPEWPKERFDLVWVFDLVKADGAYTWSFTQVPQLLLPGDSPGLIT